jgi:hypothetical protein
MTDVKSNTKTPVSNDSPKNQERTPRETESREATQHTQSWENSANLPTPDAQTGWVFRYIRTALLGQSDNPNVSRRFREGNVEIGGQLLCKMPADKAKSRDEHFNSLAKSQMESVDNVYFKDQDNRMATKQVFERKSKTSFGRDS